MFSFKLHRSGKEVVLAVCDQEILGRTFEEGEVILDVSREFYGGGLGGPEVFSAEFTSMIVVGRKAVAEAARRGLVRKTAEVSGIPYAFVFRVIP